MRITSPLIALAFLGFAAAAVVPDINIPAVPGDNGDHSISLSEAHPRPSDSPTGHLPRDPSVAITVPPSVPIASFESDTRPTAINATRSIFPHARPSGTPPNDSDCPTQCSGNGSPDHHAHSGEPSFPADITVLPVPTPSAV